MKSLGKQGYCGLWLIKAAYDFEQLLFRPHFVRELVRRRFAEEPTTRLLLTAQSNPAIDHLMGELDETLNSSEDGAPLVVRCRSKDKPEVRGFEIGNQADKMLQRIVASDLRRHLPAFGQSSKVWCRPQRGRGRRSKVSTDNPQNMLVVHSKA